MMRMALNLPLRSYHFASLVILSKPWEERAIWLRYLCATVLRLNYFTINFVMKLMLMKL